MMALDWYMQGTKEHATLLALQSDLETVEVTDDAKKELTRIATRLVALYTDTAQTAFAIGYQTARDPSWMLFKEAKDE
jgi:hypothetical protein